MPININLVLIIGILLFLGGIVATGQKLRLIGMTKDEFHSILYRLAILVIGLFLMGVVIGFQMAIK